MAADDSVQDVQRKANHCQYTQHLHRYRVDQRDSGYRDRNTLPAPGRRGHYHSGYQQQYAKRKSHVCSPCLKLKRG
jgi:hypothetical protein